MLDVLSVVNCEPEASRINMVFLLGVFPKLYDRHESRLNGAFTCVVCWDSYAVSFIYFFRWFDKSCFLFLSNAYVYTFTFQCSCY